MKTAERHEYEQQLCNLETRQPVHLPDKTFRTLPDETLHNLRLWWTKKKWDDDHKVVDIAIYRRRREW